MNYINQYHKETTERMLKRMEEWKKSPTCSTVAAERMKKNMMLGQRIEETYIANKAS